MKILGFDTATEVCTVALLDWQMQAGQSPALLVQSIADSSEHRLFSRFEHLANRQSELLLPQINSVLEEAGIKLQDLDALAFGCGPGSFTGVRLAVSVVQGLALAADIPVLPVSTLAALAYGAIKEYQVSFVLPALDARMDEIYWGLYAANADAPGITVIQDAQVTKPAQMQIDGQQAVVGVGSGWDRYHDLLLPRVAADSLWFEQKQIDAAALVELAALDFLAGKAVAAEDAAPVYVRNQVAQRPTA